jgi:hypothetical protein
MLGKALMLVGFALEQAGGALSSLGVWLTARTPANRLTTEQDGPTTITLSAKARRMIEEGACGIEQIDRSEPVDSPLAGSARARIASARASG